jgi:hypothetical protein
MRLGVLRGAAVTYLRVIPRDLFNEANLLKCYGQLWLKLEGRLNDSLTFDFEDFDGRPFEIEQRQADGTTYIANVTLFSDGRRVSLHRPLNSREPWPLYAIHPEDDDEVAVFTDDGELTDEFSRLIAPKA